MRNSLALLLLAFVPACVMPGSSEGQILHVVGFDVAEGHDAQALVDMCHTMLTGLDGVTSLQCGTRETLSTEPYIDTEYEVILVVQFRDRAAHDAYQVHPDHVALVESWMPRLNGVKVFDAGL
jgi:hypothetical protein